MILSSDYSLILLIRSSEQCEESLSALVHASVVSCSGFVSSANPLALTDGNDKKARKHLP